MDYKEKLEEAKRLYQTANTDQRYVLESLFPELTESEDERIRKDLLTWLKQSDGQTLPIERYNAAIAWLEKQGEQKEINLVEILKHYPKETELYSPLYGKLWLAEVDEKNEIITCYKHHLEEGCTRAVLKQEDTVSFYSNGTTGLPDFNVSKDCMLFLYDIEKQGEQKVSYTTLVETGNGGINALVTRELPTDGEQKPVGNDKPEDEEIINSLIDFVTHPTALLLPNKKQEYITFLEDMKENGRRIHFSKKVKSEKQVVLITESNGNSNIDWDTRSLQDVKLLLEHGLVYIKKLEKQGEQKVPVNDFKAKDWYVSKVDGKIRNIYHSVDKVEPKFKIGEWIVFNGLILHIDEIVDGYYRTTSKGGITNSYDWDIDNVARLWTIQDAKDGDVLKEDSCIFIIEKMNPNGTAIVYCCLFDDGDFDLIGSTLGFATDSTYPATKEQCDTLFKAMHNAGYEWDAEKKELKLLITNGGDFFESENCEQKPAWSVEDEKTIHNIDTAIRHEAVFPIDELKSMEIWLESLKYRIYPKHEWKRDEKMFRLIEDVIDVYRKTQGSVIGGIHTEELKYFLNCMSSRQDWKPSDEQMEALANALSLVKNCGEESAFDLRTLYEQLKKLIGE